MNGSNMTAKEKIHILKRGYGLCHQLAPTYIMRKCAASLIGTVFTYVGIYLSGMIVEMITEEKSLHALLVAVAAYAILRVLFNEVLCDVIALSKENQLSGGFLAKAKMLITEKCAGMDYAHIENPETHRKKQETENFLYGSDSRWHGIERLLYETQRIFQPLVTILIGLGLCFHALLLTPARTGGFAAFLQSRWAVPFLFLVYGIICFMRMKLSRRTGKIWSDHFSDANANQLKREHAFYAVFFTNRYQRGKDVRIYRQKELLLHEFERIEKQGFDICKGIMRKMHFPDFFASGASAILDAATYAFVIIRAIGGMYSPAEAIVLAMNLSRIADGMMDLLDFKVDYWDVLPANIKHIFDFLDLANEKYEGTIPTEKRSDNRYQFEFHHVSFKYPNADQYVLRDINLTWQIGEKMALVGRNGSGKSTLVKLLCRLYDPTEGEITLNGVDIRKYNYDEYLALFSVVFQDSQLFSFSVAENVAADTAFDRARVESCVKRAGFDARLAALAKGVDTCLYKDFDEEGVEISGGEVQKLCLARAIYKGAPFVVLDEPTAALDPISEHDIYTKFNAIVGTKTAVYISHRLSSCRFCDHITVLEKGRIVEQGSHQALLDKNGTYAALWSAQAEYYKDTSEELFA